MRKLLAVLLLAFSCNALAVDVIITMTAGQVTRFLAALGKVKNLVDAQVPPQPRAATSAEGKQWLIDNMRGLVRDVESAAAIKAAVDAVVPPAAFDPT